MVQFANRMDMLQGSEIRELLKLTAKPDIISFAGGLPAPELFPVEQMMEASIAQGEWPRCPAVFHYRGLPAPA